MRHPFSETPDLDARISRFTVGMWNGTTIHTLGDPPVFGSVAKQQADPALLWYLYGEQLEGAAMVSCTGSLMS
eukprot:COSAG02_NODE_8772_length_2450_cov_1.972352_1_plen_73_part_00